VTRSFRRHGDRIRMHLQPVEVELLRRMREGLRAVLDEGDRDDPVVARLFPSAVSDDPEADDELRGLLYDDLLAARLTGLDELVALLDGGTRHRGGLRVELDGEAAVLVLGVLNDLRLAIGARIGTEQLDRDAVGDDPDLAQRVAVMDHLAWLQEQLLAELDPPSVSVHDDLRP